MAITAAGPMILDDVKFTVDGVDLSDHVEDISVMIGGDVVPVSAMSNAWRANLRNRPGWSVAVTLLQDYYTSEVDATLRTKAISGANFALVIRPDATEATSATNPEASGNAILDGDYPFIDGTFNEKTTISLTFVGDGALSFATS